MPGFFLLCDVMPCTDSMRRATHCCALIVAVDEIAA
jgi:hypothetical protein